jgi:ABC-type branched-subunit amino acid transport system permease subunit
VPLAALVAPEASAFHLSAYTMTLAGKLMCYAIAALALDLVWGYCGILSLGHGLFFALGGYAIGMYLMREIGRDGSTAATCPTSWCSSTGTSCRGTGAARSISRGRSRWSCSCPPCWPGCSASSRSARASRACTCRSSRRR